MSKLLEALASKEELEKSNLFERYLINMAIKKGIPLSGHFELTPRCNLNCVMCYVHLTRDQMYKPELSTEEWIMLIDQACDAGMMYAALSGGECFLHPGFWEIFDHLQRNGVLVTVLTNGTLIDEEAVERLCERNPKRVQISVYGSSPEGYEQVTGSREAFYKVDKAITLLTEAKLPINFAITVTKQLLPDLKATLNYCDSKKRGVTRVNSYLFEARSDTGREYRNFKLTADEQHLVSDIQQEVYYKGNTFDLIDNTKCEQVLIKENRLVIPEKGLSCTAGRYGFAIDWDGKMIPCSVFDFASRYPLTEGFQDSWAFINKKCSEYKNPVECSVCSFNQDCRKCPAEHYGKAGEGHINPSVCAELKQMLNL